LSDSRQGECPKSDDLSGRDGLHRLRVRNHCGDLITATYQESAAQIRKPIVEEMELSRFE